jgi:hypothetical protein
MQEEAQPVASSPRQRQAAQAAKFQLDHRCCFGVKAHLVRLSKRADATSMGHNVTG